MRSAIVAHEKFYHWWPLAAEHMRRLWDAEGPTEFVRLPLDDNRPVGDVLSNPAQVERLIAFDVPLSPACLDKLTGLTEIYCSALSPESSALLKERNVDVYSHSSEGFWGQSVAEYGLALTLCGLRRIPQMHHAILSDLTPWDYGPARVDAPPGFENRGVQFGDDDRFTSGTIAGKRVRIVGAGNIASRYASWTHMLGADVAAWDPFATDPSFHLAGARKAYRLDELVSDAQIFAPMVPHTKDTEGIVTAAHIDALPKGCLVVLVTRAQICDMQAVRRRVLNDELSLAADVWDVEPLPLDDPLLGRHNVVHSPHNAGRTRHANQQFVEAIAAQFRRV